MSDIIVGLDIGTTKIACFIGQRNEETGKVKILGYGKTDSAGVERGVVKNIINASASIKHAVNMAADRAQVDVDEVYVGIAGQHIKSVENQGTVMIPAEHKYIEEEDVERLIEDQYHIMLDPGVEIIHIFPQTFIVDGEELSNEVSPIGVAGKQLKATFHIVTGNTANLRNIKDSVELAGLHIKGVVLEPVASAYAVLDDADRGAGVALVDIGGGTTDIAIFHEGIIRYTSVLPLAGNAITNDIKEGCKILKPQAETLKTRFGCCLPQNVSANDIVSIPGLRSQPAREICMKTLACIIKARTETILSQVDYEIKMSNYDKRLLAGVVLTGGGANLRNIKELAEYITSTDTRIGFPDEHVDKDTPAELKHPMYATGIGLVLYGIEESEKHHRCTEPEPEPEPEPFIINDSTPESDSEDDLSKGGNGKRKRGRQSGDNDSEPGNRFSPGKRLRAYLDRIFYEPNIDQDDSEN